MIFKLICNALTLLGMRLVILWTLVLLLSSCQPKTDSSSLASSELKSDMVVVLDATNCADAVQNPSEETLVSLTKAIEQMPESSGLYLCRAAFYRRQSKPNEALRDYETLLNLNPNDVNALMNRASFYESLEKQEKALADYTAALNLQPENNNILFERAELHLRMNRKDEARADLERIVALNTNANLSAKAKEIIAGL